MEKKLKQDMQPNALKQKKAPRINDEFLTQLVTMDNQWDKKCHNDEGCS